MYMHAHAHALSRQSDRTLTFTIDPLTTINYDDYCHKIIGPEYALSWVMRN